MRDAIRVSICRRHRVILLTCFSFILGFSASGDELLEMILTHQEQAMSRIKSYELTAEMTSYLKSDDETYNPSMTIKEVRAGRNRWFSLDMRQHIIREAQDIRQHSLKRGVSNSSYVAFQNGSGGAAVTIHERDENGQTARHADARVFAFVGFDLLLTAYGWGTHDTLREDVEASLNQDWYSWSAEAAISEEGSEVFLLRRVRADGSVMRTLTVDPSKGFATVKIERRGGSEDLVIDIYVAEVEPGVWFPMRITEKGTESSGAQERDTNYKIVEYRVNEPVDEQWFDWRNLGTPLNVTRVDPEGNVQSFALIDGREVPRGLLDPMEEEKRRLELIDGLLDTVEPDAFPENSDGQPPPVIDGAARGSDETRPNSSGSSSRVFIAVCLLSLGGLGVLVGTLWKRM